MVPERLCLNIEIEEIKKTSTGVRAEAWSVGLGRTKQTETHFSEPWNIGKRQLPGVDMQAAQFGTAMQLRKHFSGIEQPLGVESAFNALLLVQVEFGKHGWHQVPLLHADPVFTG